MDKGRGKRKRSDVKGVSATPEHKKGGHRRKSSEVDVDAFLQGIADEVGSGATSPPAPSSPMPVLHRESTSISSSSSSSSSSAADAEQLLQKLRARPADVSRLEKIEAAWKLHALLVHTVTVDAPVPAAGGAVALPSMLPLLLEWLQPTLARSERYVMAAGGGSAATPTAASKKQAKKKQKQHHGEDEDDDAAKTEEKVTETGPPQFLDERHWGLFYELLAHSPIKTIPLRTEMLRVISSALLCCVGLASAEAGISAANQAQILSLSADDRLAIVKRLEAIVHQLSSTYAQFFTPAMDHYVSFVSRVSQALIHLYLERQTASSRLPSQAEKEMESVCVAIVATALKRFQEVKQTIETNQKKVFTTIVTKLLEPLLTLRSLILTQASEDDAARSQIKRYIEDIVLHSLFHPDHLFEYSLAFSLKQNVVTLAPSVEGGESKKPAGGRGKNRQSGGAYVGTISNYRKQLFDALREYSGQTSDKQKQSVLPPARRLLVLQNIPLIYKGFLDTLKALLLAIEHSQEKRAERKDAGAADQSMDVAEEEDKKPRQYMDFHFLLELHDIIAPLLSLQSDAGNAAELAATVRVVSELMRLVEAYHVYEPTQDTDDRAHFHFLERLAHHDVGLLKQLFAYLQAHPARFDRAHQDLVGALFTDLQHLGGLSHLTLSEPIKDVWTILWNLPWPSAEAVPAACVEFSRAQLATYSKLRQLDVLLEQLLPSFVAHSGGHAHYIISSRQFTKQYYDCVMQLPMGKIASIWEIFLKEIRTTYADRLHELLPAAQQKGERGAEAARVVGPLLVSLSYVVHLFVALIDSVLLVNTTAPMVLDLVSKTCAELVSPLLVLAVGDRSGQAATTAKSPARKGGADGLAASLVRDALNVYNSLIGLREQCHRFPSTRVVAGGKKGSAKAAKASGHTVSDDVRANGSCFYLLPAKELNTLPLSTLQEWLKPELQQFPQLRFVLNVLRIQHLRRLHTFASLYALRDQPSAASAKAPAKEADAQIATLLQELRRAMEGASAGLFHELEVALPSANDTGAPAAHWNGMMASISGATYAVALWKLVAENVDILSLYAAEEHLRLFLRVLLVDSTPSVGSTTGAEDSRGMITLELVSCALLSKTSFYELPRLANSCAPVLVGAIETALHHIISDLAKGTQLAGAVELLRAMSQATEDEGDITRRFAALFAGAGAHRSQASTPGGRFESASARAGLLKLRDVLELVLALPSTYLAQEAKERSSTAVLVLDWVLHALLPAGHDDNAMQADDEECEESVRQAALAVSSTCRRYLAAMLRTPRPPETTVLSNAVVSWLHSSLRGLEKMRPLVAHTLDVVAIHIRNELRRPERARREKLEEVLASVTDSIAAEEEEGEEEADGLQEIRKVLLPLGCITNAVKALVDEYSERLGTPEQRKRLKHASLIEGNGQSSKQQQQPGIVMEETCVVFVDRAEELLLRLLDEQPLSAYLSLSASTVDTLLRSSDRDLQTTARDYFGHLLALMEQVLAFRHIEAFRRTTGRASGQSKQQQQSREARTRTVFSEIGRFASLAFQILAAGATHERSGDEEALRGRALRFVEYLCRNMHSLEPQPGRATFARFYAMLSHLMQLYTAASSAGPGEFFAKKVEACYIDLLCNSPAPCVALVARALPTELSSAQLPRLIATANCTLTLFAMNESRVLREFEEVAPTIVHKLVDLIGWCGLQLTPTTSAARGADLVHLISTALTIITHIITNRLFKIDTHTISRVLGAMSVFSVPRRRWAFAELELAHVHPAVRQQAKKKAPVTDFLPERLFLSFYSFLYRLLKIRYKQTFNCMPLFLLNIRDLLSSVFMAEQSALQSGRGTTSGRAAATERSGGGGGHQQVACTENLARLLEEMSKHPKQFNKYVAQLLVQYIQLTEVNPLSPATKQALLPGIYALLDICSEFEYKVISRQVDETGRAIFKKLFEEYHRDWKFQGKV